jgi:hypothetical protein
LTTTLTADVSGTAAGSINYTFWWNCDSASTDVPTVITACGDPNGTSGNENGIKFDGISEDPKVISHTYSLADTYIAKVIAERDTALPAESRTTITVSEPVCTCDAWSNAGCGISPCAVQSR